MGNGSGRGVIWVEGLVAETLGGESDAVQTDVALCYTHKTHTML